MISNKLIYSIIILGSLILTNCARTHQITELSSEVQNMNNKLNQVNDKVNLLYSEVEKSKNDAIRANKRLDNQISVYHK